MHLYPYAIKYWSRTIPIAKSVLYHLTEQKSFQKLTSLDQDDHYLFYRLSEYLEYDSIKTEEGELPQTDSAPLEEKKQATETITDISEKEPPSPILKQTPSDSQNRVLSSDASKKYLLPFEQEGEFQKYFPESGLFVKKNKVSLFCLQFKKRCLFSTLQHS